MRRDFNDDIEIVRNIATGGNGVKAHAIRLALDIGHLQSERPTTQISPTDLCPDLAHLPRAGSMLAAAWFTVYLSGEQSTMQDRTGREGR